MADEQVAAPQEDAPLVVNLNLIQPSGTLLSFARTPAATTLRQLKAKVREGLPSRPSDEQIRFIYRGHLLQRDTDTLLDVFTEQVIRSSGDQQSLHMVIRDVVNQPSGNTPQLATPNRGQSPAPGNANAPPNNHAQPPFGRQPHIQFHPQHGIRVAAAGFIPPPQPMVHHLQHQDMVQWGAHLQREAFQRQVAHMNTQRHFGYGIPPLDGVHHGPVMGAEHPAHALTRDMVGPNGQQVRITVQNEVVAPAAGSAPGAGGPTSNPGSQRPSSANQTRDWIHGDDAARASQTITDAMQRSASGASLANMAANLANSNGPIQPIQPGVTTPLFPGVSRHASRSATPDPHTRHAAYGIPPLQRQVAPQGQSQSQPQGQQGQSQARALDDLEVHILYDQAGPRALLVNSPLDLYTSRQPHALPVRPPQHVYQPMGFGIPPMAAPLFYPPPFYPPPAMYLPPFQPSPMPLAFQQPQPGPVPPPLWPNPNAAAHGPVQPQQGQAQAGFQAHPVDGLRHRVQQAQVAAPANPPLVRPPQFGHQGNPGGWVVAAWPTVWLIIRLAAFAFWFSYSNPSWERWLSLSIVSLILLAFHTGILNALVNEVFQPIREHIENLIPNPEHQNQQRPAQNAPAGAAQVGNPDPAETARRLVAQRRNANGNWLQNQARWLERAGILLLASLAPGVAERHIQQLEAREREERRAAEEAAERERAAARAAQEAQTEGQQPGHEDGADHGQQEESPVQPQPQAQAPLVEV